MSVAAFDTADHNILLDVLEKRFGMSQNSIKWFERHLRPRTLKVNVGSSYSSSKVLAFSLPKGSFAGPVLSSAYTSTMNDVISLAIDILGYAEYHSLKKCFSGSSRNEERITIRQMSDSTSTVKHGRTVTNW